MLRDILLRIDKMAPLFARNTHARRMAIAAMVCHPDDICPALLADATMSTDLFSVAEAVALPAEAYERIFLTGNSTPKMAERLVSSYPRLFEAQKASSEKGCNSP